MVNVNFENLLKWLVDNKVQVKKAADLATSVYWENLPLLEKELANYEIFKFNCKYETFAELMYQEFKKRFL